MHSCSLSHSKHSAQLCSLTVALETQTNWLDAISQQSSQHVAHRNVVCLTKSGPSAGFLGGGGAGLRGWRGGVRLRSAEGKEYWRRALTAQHRAQGIEMERR